MGKGLLTHVLALHNLLNSIFHTLVISVSDLYRSICIGFTKVKQILDSCKFLKNNLAFKRPGFKSKIFTYVNKRGYLCDLHLQILIKKPKVDI